ncbi:AtpZ/AtpI family protein [Mucilaginibacter sp. RS28]|uniref:AtpZ/AtpI family protein n=1 Tax=Mucilaginibacter straminoryzae TaxID=2932774 RepID=A0A9X2B997_9SPHI|nr:AtpZ/AtpI family protein [Mucilaginibacter straminoryzae]MCJ8210389.1 AtpZ/AtpI family protein [Mucilaginibacter straminoryzae]
MAEPKKDNGTDNKPVNNYIKYSGIAFQMFAIIGVMTFIGYKIDQYQKHDTAWVTAMLSLTGVFISLYLVIKSLKD